MQEIRSEDDRTVYRFGDCLGGAAGWEGIRLGSLGTFLYLPLELFSYAPFPARAHDLFNNPRGEGAKVGVTKQPLSSRHLMDDRDHQMQVLVS